MTLQDIAQICWDNRASISFGNVTSWPDNVFQKAWFKIYAPELWVVGGDAPGWYWFETNVPVADLQVLAKPQNLPNFACDFGSVSTSNVALFDMEICQKKSNICVVYNGEQKKVFDRIRSHFSLSNNSTGALGLKHYTVLSINHWAVSLFERNMIEKKLRFLSANDRTLISNFCDSGTGRKAIEGAWRSLYGWPVLCKA